MITLHSSLFTITDHSATVSLVNVSVTDSDKSQGKLHRAHPCLVRASGTSECSTATDDI